MRNRITSQNDFIKWKKEVFVTLINQQKKSFFKDTSNSFYLFQDDCLQFLDLLQEKSVDMIFADPPYFLSNGGITCHAGRMVSVNKGEWDKSMGVDENHEFNLKWLGKCQNVLKDNGTIWVSGTAHVIYSIGFAMQKLGFKILNDIAWYKINPPPNLSCRYFTHGTETILWAARNNKSKHCFNYPLMKKMNNNKQMQSLWSIRAPGRQEKEHGKHPTQKPLELLERIILASTREGDVVLDPFTGSSTTGIAAHKLNRNFIGIDNNKSYLELSVQRFKTEANKEVSLKEMVLSP